MLYHQRHIIVSLLLFSYLFLGAIGYVRTFILSGFGTNPQYLAQTTSGPPTATKVYWTQYKHIPSTVKITVPSPAVFMPPEMPHVWMFGISFTQGVFRILSNPSFSINSSRAPPQI